MRERKKRERKEKEGDWEDGGRWIETERTGEQKRNKGNEQNERDIYTKMNNEEKAIESNTDIQRKKEMGKEWTREREIKKERWS